MPVKSPPPEDPVGLMSLPTETQAWPRNDASISGIPKHQDDFAHDLIKRYTVDHIWRWTDRTVYFFCDVHADADAFLLSLVASGGIVRTGPDDGDFELTDEGGQALFILGGDCFDKGPSTLRLLDVIFHLKQSGADFLLLAGNHDVRTYLGVVHAESKQPLFDHLFVRLGRKSVPLLKEIYERYVTPATVRLKNGPEAKSILYPDGDWFHKFPGAAQRWMSSQKIEKEIRRVKEKSVQFEQEMISLGMSFDQIYLSVQQFKKLFLEPDGKYYWFFNSMEMAHREESYLFLHAGLDDDLADKLSLDVAQANREFRQTLANEPFALYHGMMGNAFRTKYRTTDAEFTQGGAKKLHESGIHAVVHGHRNNCHGQRVVIRSGMMNFECDATVDRNTRIKEGLPGIGLGVVVFVRDGTVKGISGDFPYIKTFNPGYL